MLLFSLSEAGSPEHAAVQGFTLSSLFQWRKVPGNDSFLLPICLVTNGVSRPLRANSREFLMTLNAGVINNDDP